jgi:hypothetical protein
MLMLMAERRRLMTAIERIEAITAAPYAASGPSQTSDRWAFTRELMLHLKIGRAHV